MLTVEAIVGSGRVPPRGDGNDKLNPVASSCECSGLALNLLPGAIAVLLGAGPAGQRQSRDCACCWARARRGNAKVARCL